MRKLRVLLTSLTIPLVFCAPATAQTSPAEVQYVGEAAQAAADDVGQGAAAVNDAMSGDASSASASASGSAGASGSEDGRGTSASEGSARITRLPETGGTTLASLFSGILLVVSGSLMHKLGRR